MENLKTINDDRSMLEYYNEIFSSVRQISQKLDELFVPLVEKYDLTGLKLMIILMLGTEENYSSSIGNLGSLVGVTGGNISNITKNIEELGYIKRQRSSVDDRVVEVKLTEKGHELCDAAEEYLKGISELKANDGDNEKKVKLVKILKSVSRDLGLLIYLGKGNMGRI